MEAVQPPYESRWGRQPVIEFFKYYAAKHAEINITWAYYNALTNYVETIADEPEVISTLNSFLQPFPLMISEWPQIGLEDEGTDLSLIKINPYDGEIIEGSAVWLANIKGRNYVANPFFNRKQLRLLLDQKGDQDRQGLVPVIFK